MRYDYRALAILVASVLCVSGEALAVSIAAVGVVNNSSADDFTPPSLFQTQSTLSAVGQTSNSATFEHRMAFYNSYSAPGGVAQTHKRNVAYTIDFTVDDPGNLGFEVNAASFLRGISWISQTSNGGTALATGASFGVEYDDSTDAPDTWSNLNDLFNQVDGTSVTGINSAIFTGSNSESAYLGAFTGTTSFSLRFSTFFTPTTNVLFQNNQTGSGQVDYGLGTLAEGLELDPDDLGHFVTISVTFVPEPATVALFGAGIVGMLLLGRRRPRG